MHPQAPSRTALAAASHRAAHQLLEDGQIFADPLAVRILGLPADEIMAAAAAEGFGRGMRLFIAARTHFAEACLARAVQQHAVTQLVVLGAGLDSFAYRNPFGARLQVFEVDHPATQAWKRLRLAEAGIALPPWLRFAPVDFETGTLQAGLREAGFNPEQRCFVTWLGVVPYLTQAAIFATLGTIAAFPGGAGLVFDYGDPPEALDEAYAAMMAERAARVAALGEPWLSFFEPQALHAALRQAGFAEIEDLGPPELAARYWPSRLPLARPRGGHVIYAATQQPNNAGWTQPTQAA